jgi:hypothetical protein
MSKLNVPPLLEQYRENMLDTSNSPTVRHNYMMSIQNIRDFCDKCIVEYNRQQAKKAR